MKLKNEKNKNTFLCAIDGFKQAIKTERNLKIHCIMAILVIICGFIFKININEWVMCIALISLVISAELMNTAIETVVYLYTKEKNNLAKKAKDVSAGAVLVIAIMAAIIGCMIFIPKMLYLIK